MLNVTFLNTTMKELKSSETRVIRRSQINLNPVNPKRHTDEAVKFQKKNLQKVGYLGGVVWNETSANIVDGHRRVLAMDQYYKYDGTEATDYDVKVEVVSLDDKSEKEQLTYMAVGNTKADIDLIAEYASDIDLANVGISQEEVDEILSFNSEDIKEIESYDEDFFTPEPPRPTVSDVPNAHLDNNPTEVDMATSLTEEEQQAIFEERKQAVKDAKERQKEIAAAAAADEMAYIMLSFSSNDAREDFCDMMGINTDERFVKGEEVMRRIN